MMNGSRSPTTGKGGSALIWKLLTFSGLVLLAVLPLNLPAQAAAVLHLLPVLAIYHWAAGSRDGVPAIAVFAGGILVDIVSAGPLGFWPATYLAAQVFSASLPPRYVSTVLRKCLGLAATVTSAVSLQWVVASVYLVTLADWRPTAIAGVIILSIYGLFSLIRAIVVPGHRVMRVRSSF